MTSLDGKVHHAKSLQMRGRTVEAEALYREVLREAPDTASALEGLGVLVFQQGEPSEAAELFARGVALCPESARFHANLGEACARPTGPTQALSHLRRATELDPTLPHAWNSLALLAYSESRFAESEASCREAIRLSPTAHRGLHQPGQRAFGSGPAGGSGRGAAGGPAHRAAKPVDSHEPGLVAVRIE